MTGLAKIALVQQWRSKKVSLTKVSRTLQFCSCALFDIFSPHRESAQITHRIFHCYPNKAAQNPKEKILKSRMSLFVWSIELFYYPSKFEGSKLFFNCKNLRTMSSASQLASEIGWDDGWEIPVANDENKRLTAELAELSQVFLKKSTDGANPFWCHPWGKIRVFSRAQFFLCCERLRKDFSIKI